MQAMGKILIIFGALLLVLGVIFLFIDKIPWLGHLPGDIHIKGKNMSIYIPIMTSIILSIILTIILNLIMRK